MKILKWLKSLCGNFLWLTIGFLLHFNILVWKVFDALDAEGIGYFEIEWNFDAIKNFILIYFEILWLIDNIIVANSMNLHI